MKFLLDQPITYKVATCFRRRGHECIHVDDLHMSRADDQHIWEFSKASNFIVVTKDSDFAELALRVDDCGRVLWIRRGNGRLSEIIADVEAGFQSFITAFESGQRIVQIG